MAKTKKKAVNNATLGFLFILLILILCVWIYKLQNRPVDEEEALLCMQIKDLEEQQKDVLDCLQSIL